MNKGLILRPDSDNLDMNINVDSDFAGLWPYEENQDPTSVKSRIGFVICIASCPIVWISKLFEDISMSTMEVEYSTLAMAMKSVLPLRRVIKQLSIDIGLVSENLTTFKTRVHEDNNGCLTLSKLEPGRMTLRSKHYAVKYHWFRSHLKPNAIEIIKIETKLQKADIFTKGLRTHRFVENQKLLMGW